MLDDNYCRPLCRNLGSRVNFGVKLFFIPYLEENICCLRKKMFPFFSCRINIIVTSQNTVNHFYFRVFFISRFWDWKLIRGNLHSRWMRLSYVNLIKAHILRECWIREGSNSRILAKIKFSRIIVNLQKHTVFREIKCMKTVCNDPQLQ